MYVLTRPTNRSAELQNTFGRLNRLMDEALGGWVRTEDDDSLVGAWMPPVDVTENHDMVRVDAELPGIRPEDVNIQLENNVLTIRGEKTQEHRAEGDRSQRYERVYGSFERSFLLPSTVDADKIAATYENGVLRVTLPKVERAKPRAISVQVTRGGEVAQGGGKRLTK